ncbi:MAG: RpiB/LacA/LacB family sugar-phosphate isomerase [Patescibacteria group bacterium]|jgi:ribose 5-phosphate isomerase B|nr:RpiB/LacA/LacB family sugar-phosphate isomerase [Patescibacteria group bacterium]
MNIYFAADHNGYYLKDQLIDYIGKFGEYSPIDVGNQDYDKNDDFPNYAFRAINKILNDKDSVGVFICGSGQGMAMAANRFKNIRASLCWNTSEAIDSRNDDNANVLCFSSKQTSLKQAKTILTVWLSSEFSKAPRFIRRINELDQFGS